MRQLPLLHPALEWYASLGERTGTVGCVCPLVIGDPSGPFWWAVREPFAYGWSETREGAWAMHDEHKRRGW